MVMLQLMKRENLIIRYVKPPTICNCAAMKLLKKVDNFISEKVA